MYVGPRDHLNRVCPVCNSYGRQRFLALLFARRLSSDSVTSKKTLLHFSPELGLQRWLRKRSICWTYISADLCSPEVDLNLDIQGMDIPDNTIDIVVLSHVLEHIPDDIRAIREIHRILAPGGELYVQVPLSGEQLTLDERLDTPEMRLARYGKTDHVRLYGDDLLERLANVGLKVTVCRASDSAFNADFDYMGLDIPRESAMLYASESSTYICQKE